jgi:hypothetical protein
MTEQRDGAKDLEVCERSTHTPEPWFVADNPKNPQWVAGRTIGSRSAGMMIGGRVIGVRVADVCHIAPEEIAVADARRIVACVNALAGIKDPEAFVRKLQSLEGERDRLRAALEKIADYTGWCRRNIPKGHKLDGQWVVRAAELPSTYINIAHAALNPLQEAGEE